MTMLTGSKDYWPNFALAVSNNIEKNAWLQFIQIKFKLFCTLSIHKVELRFGWSRFDLSVFDSWQNVPRTILIHCFVATILSTQQEELITKTIPPLIKTKSSCNYCDTLDSQGSATASTISQNNSRRQPRTQGQSEDINFEGTMCSTGLSSIREEWW